VSKVTSFLQDKFNLRRRRSRQAPDEAGNEGLVELARGQKSMIPLYLVYVIAFLLGRVQIIGTLSPFGPGFYVGYRTVLGGFSILSAVAVLAGTASLKQWELLIPAGISMAGITLLVRDEDKAGYGRVANASIAGFCVFMARAITGIATGLNLSLYLSAFMEALCTIVSGLIFISAFDRASGTEKPGWRSGRVGQALMLMGLFAVGGLQGVKLFNLDIGVIVIMAATFALAYACGPSVGALTGILGGLVACMTGLESPEIIGQLGVIGVLSGLGGKLGKLEATLGYLSAGLTMAFFSDSASLIRHMLMEQILASAVVLLITPGVRGCLLESVSGLMPGVRRLYRRVGPDGLPEEMGEYRTSSVFNVLSELGRLFEEASVTRPGSSEQNAPPDLDVAVMKHLYEKTCQDCGNRAYCWEEHFGETYEEFINLARKARLTGKLGLHDSSLAIADKCGRFREMVLHLNYENHIDRLEKQLASIESDTIGCLAYQFKCLGRLRADVDPDGGIGVTGKKRASLTISVKGTTIPASGVEKPGDMWTRYDLDPGRTLLVLVDGMGKGEIAAKQSRDAIRLLKSLIECRLDHAACISFLNSALHLAWRPDSFVALDCVVIDAEVERAYFYKLGAPPSFIRKGDGNVLAVRGSNPPAGAVTHVYCHGTSEPISPGDLIFLVSDGVFRSSPVPARAEHMLMMRLSRMKQGTLGDYVKSLVNHSLRHQRQTPNDDITVVGVLIESI
jgi:stage II sporulation protein E